MQPGEIDGSEIFEDPDAPLRALLVELEQVDMELRTAGTIGGDVDSLREQHRDIRARIEAMPAFGAEGLRAKARAADLAGRREGHAMIGPSGFVALAASLVRDLLDLGAASSVQNLPAPSTSLGL